MEDKRRNKKRTAPSTQQEAFIQALLKGDSQRQAYLKAYPKRASWKGNSLDVEASKLFNNPMIKLRYEKLLAELQKEEQEKTKWTREQSIDTLKYVIGKNKEDLERIQTACEDELLGLLAMIQLDPNKAVYYTELAIKQRKQRRISSIHNSGIVGAVAELNKMQGFNEETINMNETVRFCGEEELKD